MTSHKDRRKGIWRSGERIWRSGNGKAFGFYKFWSSTSVLVVSCAFSHDLSSMRYNIHADRSPNGIESKLITISGTLSSEDPPNRTRTTPARKVPR
jgi:hypothetical protein